MDSFKSTDVAERSSGTTFSSEEIWGTHERQFSLERSGAASYVVKPGDNAWNIAADLTRELNKQFPEHKTTNAEILAMLKTLESYNKDNIKDLGKIYPGDVIEIPPDIRGAIELSQRSDSEEGESTMSDKQIQANDEVDSTSAAVWAGIDRANAVTHAEMRDFFSKNYAKLDRNTDGFVSDDELLSMLKNEDLSVEDRTLGEAIHKRFDQIAQLNNDGEHFWQSYQLSGADMGKASRLDAEGDEAGVGSKIDAAIAASVLKQRADASASDFNALDRDKSGTLSQNELIEDMTDRSLSNGERRSAIFLTDNYDAILGHSTQTGKGELKLPQIDIFGEE